MLWADVLNDKSLQDLPYKIELNRLGQIVMSPASNRHAFYQGELQWRIRLLTTTGKCFPECSVETSEGVKVPDVVWLSDGFYQTYQYATPYPAAPELCVEVISPSNSAEEIAQKAALYFERGAHEVWTCDQTGHVTFLAPTGEISQSQLFPLFPVRI